MYKALIFKKPQILKNPKGFPTVNKIIIICDSKNISIVQMYETDFEITYYFWTGHQNINFNGAFGISDLIVLNN